MREREKSYFLDQASPQPQQQPQQPQLQSIVDRFSILKSVKMQPYKNEGFQKYVFLPISVWKIGQQSIGVAVVVVGDVVKTLDRKNSFSRFLASNGEKIGYNGIIWNKME